MKSIVSELKNNIHLMNVEEAEERSLVDFNSKRALKLLKQAIIDTGYNPNSIYIARQNIVFRKNEITVSFSLRPQGFVYRCGEKPKVIVHLKSGDSSYIYPQTLIKALDILVDPRCWKEGP